MKAILMQNLNLASTDELLNELFSRFDHIGVCGLRVSSVKNQKMVSMRRYKGNAHTVVGLTQDLSRHILGEIDKVSTFIPIDDL